MNKHISIIFILFIITFLLSGCTKKVSYQLIPSNDTIEVYTEYHDMGCIITINDKEYPMTVDSNNVNTNEIGTYIIHYSYTLNNTVYTYQRVVFVTDQTPPVVTLNEGVDTIHVGDDWIDSSVTAIDNYSTDLFITTNGTVDTSVPGTYQIEYIVTDEAQNSTNCIRIVTVIE